MTESTARPRHREITKKRPKWHAGVVVLKVKYHKSFIEPPPPSNMPPPSNKPPPFKGRKSITPPPPYLFFSNK